jgi:DNA-binding CsgD family transcriptional regulator
LRTRPRDYSCAGAPLQPGGELVYAAPSLLCTSPNHLILSLQSGGKLLGLAGVGRNREDDRWAADDILNLRQVVSALCALIHLHHRCTELSRYAVTTRLMAAFVGAMCVVDLDSGRVTWIDADQTTPEQRARILENEAALAAAAAEALAHGPSRTGLRWTCGNVVQAADLGIGSLFGGGRSVLLGLEMMEQESAAARSLSKRERQIADLLVAGYAAINAAAILDLSEHTVRTYIRRLYRKLHVSNRADLVRKLVSSSSLGCALSAAQ